MVERGPYNKTRRVGERGGIEAAVHGATHEFQVGLAEFVGLGLERADKLGSTDCKCRDSLRLI